ncbi:RNA-directed DNA methylation 4 isoform X1 [Prunus yedoensis var. nudiflora]|uniref:RNA-directed DNA methylation 4 isoform X1 n=1 Tax=Prunus yedoensis var. nudiflora TaxID=2094558 RepID=A0A314ZBW2_PRUYE|nr:RNA-directed DNA methylation 4 isoform X1 [Prunus yedoensis var. nudiflora]
MAVVGESSSALAKSPEDKPVIVRVKRKALQSPLDAFWLEINERPQKRPLLDFENLSMSDSAAKAEELKTKKVFVQHVETVSSFHTTVDVVKSFVDLNSDDVCDRKTRSEERKHTFKKENQKQDQILSKARQKQEVVAKNARFEQIWRSRKGNKETSHEKLHEMCHFYDVIRVDVEEISNELQQEDEISWEDQRMLNSYLPLLREFIPSAASEIESDLSANSSKQGCFLHVNELLVALGAIIHLIFDVSWSKVRRIGFNSILSGLHLQLLLVEIIEDGYVYDLYAVKEEMDIDTEDSSKSFPLVQVDDEDLCDGPDESEYDTDDSNAENNPLNDYPEEISEEESESDTSDDESEENESSSEKSSEPKGLEDNDFLEDDMYDENDHGDDFDYDVDQSDDGEDRRWSYR